MFSINGNKLDIQQFPDKTPLLRLPKDIAFCYPQLAETRTIMIEWNYDNDAELFQLICLTRALQDIGYTHIDLIMPYIPNARMDRVKESDEVFTLKYFAEIINGLKFDNVYVLDAHSNVSLALIDRVRATSVTKYIRNAIVQIGETDNLTMFFPDEGAMKRYSSIAKYFGVPYAFGIKTRDWRTGDIKGLTLAGQTDEIKQKNILIIDDISSKGGTFYHSAKALKDAGADDIYLYVSHCEDTILKGDLINSGLMKKIFTTDSIYRAEHPLIQVL